MSARNVVIDNLRGLAMLGVIGIHAGSYVMESGTPWISLYFLCEILSRYAVPAFFFISGYGLFLQHPLEEHLAYGTFLRKRFQSVGIPYLFWSCFYLIVWHSIPLNPMGMDWGKLGEIFFFADASYHLYFLVILLWFYITLPLWRWLVGLINRHNLWLGLAILTALQVKLYLWSDKFWVYPAWFKEHHFLLRLLDDRINYCPLFYGLVFVVGALVALHTQKFKEMLQKHFASIFSLFAVAVGILIQRFNMYASQGMKLDKIPEYLQQLTPEGLFYTLTSLTLFAAILLRLNNHKLSILKSLSKHSYIIYLVHPFFLDGFYYHLPRLGIPYDALSMPVHYLMVLGASWLTSVAVMALARKFKTVGLLLMGK
jgi:surface polysaccharide O-acyltransferase-like enzyme